MNSPRDLYRAWHPEQFSDSSIIKKSSLQRDFLEYYLSKITSHSQEKDFERFCKSILEHEVCPNLLTQTGPTGGGDSKVDTETFPVSEKIAESWLYGFADKAESERWAFAISAKTDWTAKVRSDVEKIATTIINNGRSYSKVFFVSNQHISDKRRAQLEDELRSKYAIDIRIFGMDWLLDAVFRNETNRQIAIDTLNLSKEFIDEKQIGEKDYKRQHELNEIENCLKDITSHKASEIVNAARKSLILSRELELDEQEVLMYIDRYNRLAKEYGTVVDQADALYESAKTVLWWYPSRIRFHSFYREFENIAVEYKTTYLFDKLCTLYMNLFSFAQEDENHTIDLHKHLCTIRALFEYLVSDINKPNTILSARTSYQMIRFSCGDSIEDIVKDYIDIIEQSENSLCIDVEVISKIILRVSQFQESKNYDRLFDLVVNRLSKEKHDSEAAILNAQRGLQLIESDPYKALSFFSKAVLSFHNEANKDSLIRTVLWMAHLYEDVGLHWAARNYYYYVVAYCFNQYLREGEVTPFFAIAANRLKWIELFQGRVMFSSEMNTIETLARNAYPDTLKEDPNHYDALFPFLLFRTSYDKLCELGKLPQYLEEKGLVLSAAACRYELGHYDAEMLQAMNNSTEEFDNHMKSWANQPAWDQIRFTPWYGFESECVLESRIMGCEFIVHSPNDMFVIEFSSTLLATLECFLGTGFHNNIYSRANKFDIDVQLSDHDSFAIDFEHNKADPTRLLVRISKFCDSEFQKAHTLLNDKLIEIIAAVISSILISNEDFQKLKEVIENESIMARVNIFTDSLFYGYSTFGSDAFSYEQLVKEFDAEPVNRIAKVALYAGSISPNHKPEKQREVIFGMPSFISKETITNDQVFMTDVINVPLWDISGWRGVAYLIYPSCRPILSLMFSNDSGLKIFSEWIDRYGKDDINDVIGLRIIKGIDVDHPYWYRISIGENTLFANRKQCQNYMVINPCRLHTLQPDNNANISLFEHVQSMEGDYFICPTIVDENGQQVNHYELCILKHAKSIKIIHAYEIEKTDILSIEAVFPTDKPIIPLGYEECDLIKVLNNKS